MTNPTSTPTSGAPAAPPTKKRNGSPPGPRPHCRKPNNTTIPTLNESFPDGKELFEHPAMEVIHRAPTLRAVVEQMWLDGLDGKQGLLQAVRKTMPLANNQQICTRLYYCNRHYCAIDRAVKHLRMLMFTEPLALAHLTARAAEAATNTADSIRCILERGYEEVETPESTPAAPAVMQKPIDKDRRAELRLCAEVCKTLITAYTETEKTEAVRDILQYHAPSLEALLKKVHALAPDVPGGVVDGEVRDVGVDEPQETV